MWRKSNFSEYICFFLCPPAPIGADKANELIIGFYLISYVLIFEKPVVWPHTENYYLKQNELDF